MSSAKRTCALISPWLKYYTRDHLDHKELRRCSHLARSVWADLICLMAEGTPRGFLADKVGTLDLEYVAARIVTSVDELRAAIEELVEKQVAQITEDGLLYSPKMVRDEEIRLRRASGGIKSLDNPRVARRKTTTEGYPSVAGVEPTPIVSSPVASPPKESAADILTALIMATAKRLHGRHPAVRRCGMGKVQERLRSITKDVPAKERAAVLEFIDSQHAAMCATEGWTKDGGEFAKGLDNWLAPTERRWENDPPAEREKPQDLFGRMAI